MDLNYSQTSNLEKEKQSEESDSESPFRDLGFAIGIDLGGTRIKAVAIDTDGNVLHENYQPTNDGDDKVWKNAVANAVKELQAILKIKKLNIGLSAPGLPNESNTAIACMPGRMQGIEKFIWTDFLH